MITTQNREKEEDVLAEIRTKIATLQVCQDLEIATAWSGISGYAMLTASSQNIVRLTASPSSKANLMKINILTEMAAVGYVQV